jgi:hypothetical protein
MRLASQRNARARLEMIAGALDRIAPEHRDARPWLVYWRAASTLRRQGSGAHELAERAFRDFRVAGQPVGILLSWALLVQALCTVGDDLIRWTVGSTRWTTSHSRRQRQRWLPR